MCQINTTVTDLPADNLGVTLVPLVVAAHRPPTAIGVQLEVALKGVITARQSHSALLLSWKEKPKATRVSVFGTISTPLQKPGSNCFCFVMEPYIMYNIVQLIRFINKAG